MTAKVKVVIMPKYAGSGQITPILMKEERPIAEETAFFIVI
jgi:hypothetical protein